MDYTILAYDVLALYSIEPSNIQFIRHNENITFKIVDEVNLKNYLLRIHKPSMEGLLGIQHTLKGINSEVLILQALNHNNLVLAQRPVANNQGDYITKCELDNYNLPCYATILEWIEGDTLNLKMENINELAFSLGKNLALFHRSLKGFKSTVDVIRPIYDTDRIDNAISELKYCVEIDLFSMAQYEIIKSVLLVVKCQMEELRLREDSWGIIHADMQLGNVVVNNNNPSLIDLGFCGFGYYAFDLGSAATCFPSELRQTFLNGYSSEASFTFEDLRYIEGQIFMDTFISYVLFMKDHQRNAWIKTSASNKCDTVCKNFLEGKEVFYSL